MKTFLHSIYIKIKMFRKNKTYTMDEIIEIPSDIKHDRIETNGLLYILTEKDSFTFKKVDNEWQLI
jgi:hypothetical protein